MNKLAAAFILLVAVSWANAQQPAAAEAESAQSKAEHLLKAAAHLEAAGMADDAMRIRRRAAALAGHANTAKGPAVLLNIRVIDVSRTKLRRLGFDLDRALTADNAASNDNKSEEQTGAKAMDNGPSRSVVAVSHESLPKVLDALVKDNLAAVVAAPTFVTLSNHPASLHVGGEARVAAARDDGRVTVVKRPYGVMVDACPVVSEDKTIRLSCRIELSELDMANGVVVGGETIPALRSRCVQSTSQCKPGRTIVLRGLRQQRTISTVAAADGDKPKVQKSVEDVEMLVLVTPEIVTSTISQKPAETQPRR